MSFGREAGGALMAAGGGGGGASAGVVGGGDFVFLVQAVLNLDWASPGRRCLRRWALARALAGAGRGSDAGVLREQELSEEHSLVIFGSIT